VLIRIRTFVVVTTLPYAAARGLLRDGRHAPGTDWIAILASNTLGTSSGDWLSDDTGLGFRNAFLVIAGILALIVTLHYLTPINGTVLFWLAFILTRPLGAAGGDSLTKPLDQSGLGWGTVGASAALLSLLVALTTYQTWQLRQHPLAPLPAPANRHTGQPQRPNGAPAERRIPATVATLLVFRVPERL
jgi:repeat uncharacterized protein DUF347